MATFDETYAAHFGGRWEALRGALCRPGRHVAWLNPYANQHPAGRPVSGLPGCLAAEGLPAPTPGPDGLLGHYFLDGASVAVARALGVQSGERVLDLCAAPGGKSLVLMEALRSGGELVANERSSRRRARLHEVLEAYLPPDARRRVTVTGHDATRWGLHERAAYDRVLLDAPCSGERHLLCDPDELAKWSPHRSKRLAQQQHAMLCAALEAVKIGGRIVYSTCALSPLENDGAIERWLKKRQERLQSVEVQPPFGEPTAHGWQILPDRTGWGPMYLAAFTRRS